MKIYFAGLVLLCPLIMAHAQQEISKKKFSAPIVPKAKYDEKSPSSAFPKTSPFTQPLTITPLFDKKPPIPSKYQIGETSKINLTPAYDFINPGEEITKKLNNHTADHVSEDFKIVRGNQYLGDFKSNAKAVNIKFRDFGEVDGDDIRVYVNGKVLINRAILDYEYQGLKVDLEIGFNKIEFEALSQGRVGPNTAQFQVFDDVGNLIASNMWNLATGFKASIIVVKE